MPDKPLPITTVYDFDEVDKIISAAAFAVSTQLSLSSGWKHDDSFASNLVWFASVLNVPKGAYNYLKHGQYTQTTSGAQEVTTDARRRTLLYDEAYRGYWSYYQRCMGQGAGGAGAALQYLETLIKRTRFAWAAITEQFEAARRINNGVSVSLNNALDTTYRIRTAASIAFLVVGSLPVAAAAAGTATAAGAGTAATTTTAAAVTSFSYTGAAAGSFTIVASASTPWVMALKVAGLSAVYGFLTEMAFNKDDVRRSGATAVDLGDGGKGAAWGGGANLGQQGLEHARLREERALLQAARQTAQRDSVRNAVREVQSAARGRSVPPRPMTNEVQRRLSSGLAEHAERRLARIAPAIARSGSVLFIGAGLYSMREDIRTALDGVTRDIDRTR